MAKIKIVEVGPRDGLQNEKQFIDIDVRVEFIKKLVSAGCLNVEVGAFVSPDKIPQMVGSDEVLKSLNKIFSNRKSKKITFPVLVPNERGMLDAIQAGANEVAVFAAASDSFSKANINCTTEESFERFEPVIKLAKKHKIKDRGYLSTCFYCPFEGKIKSQKVSKLAKQLIAMGCYEVSIGDTIGAADPKEVKTLIQGLKRSVPVRQIAMHFHDTRGTALANILESVKLGITTFDSSLGGLGGCPYAKGATGNVATEDVLYMMRGLDIETGVDLDAVVDIGQWISHHIGHKSSSRAGNAIAARKAA